MNCETPSNFSKGVNDRFLAAGVLFWTTGLAHGGCRRVYTGRILTGTPQAPLTCRSCSPQSSNSSPTLWLRERFG